MMLILGNYAIWSGELYRQWDDTWFGFTFERCGPSEKSWTLLLSLYWVYVGIGSGFRGLSDLKVSP